MNYNDELRGVLNTQPIDYELVRQLIEDGASPDTTNDNGENYLHLAIRKQWGPESILQAIALGINVRKYGRDNRTPLSSYLSQEKIVYKVVEALIAKGADRNTTANGENYLHIAIRNQWNKETILRVIALGIDVNRTNQNGETALQSYLNRMKNKSDADVVAALIKAGANPKTNNSNGENFLHMAIKVEKQEDRAEKIIQAIEMGINVMSTNDQNETAVQHYRRRYGVDNSSSLELLRECSHVANRVEQKPVQFDYACIANCPNPGEMILDVLRTNSAKNPPPIDWLAKQSGFKEKVIQHIRELPDQQQTAIIELALNPETPLCAFFSVQRGWLKTNANRGSLGVLNGMKSGLTLFSKTEEAGVEMSAPTSSAMYPDVSV